MNSNSNMPELILGDGSPTSASRLSRLLAKGLIRKIYQKVYTSNLTESLKSIVKRHAHHIAGHICPNGVLSHRTAFEGGLVKESLLVITENSERTITLPGLTIKVVKGPPTSDNDLTHIGTLRMSSFSRMLLENLQSTRNKGGIRKTVTREIIESKLDQICSINGEKELNSIRDNAEKISEQLGMQKEFKKLNALISSLLGTRTNRSLSTASGIARSKGHAYDTHRIDLFDTLCHALIENSPQEIADPIDATDTGTLNIRAFFESYFSNYIEGTKFVLSDAKDIVFNHTIHPNKPQDSHDISATFQLASNFSLFEQPLSKSNEFIELLKNTHLTLMSARPELDPGKFKLIRNQAGSTQFVDPLLVPGTLSQMFERAAQLSNPLAKAIFVMFAISEIHPFNDGNGRTARIIMNGELSRKSLCRIIIPTNRRVDYVQSLKAMSQGKPSTFVGFMARMHRETAQINFRNIETATAQYESMSAFDEYPEGFSML